MARVSESNYSPLTGSERWKLYLNMTYSSVGAYFTPVLTALLLDQARGTPKQWGTGASGLGRRVASRVGNSVVQGSFQAPMAAVLHEDVRYIASNQHGFKRRAEHALVYSFVTYNRQGHRTPNIAWLASFYAATAVSSAWLPGIRNPTSYTFTNATEQIAISASLNIFQEFWPEIDHHFFHRH
jgi:hypothetical protein